MRYALYFAPPADAPLARLGARWLGRDARTGEGLRQPEVAGASAALFAEWTAEPRRYGFHATLKAPFRLAEGRSARDLMAAADEYAAKARGAMIDAIAVRRIAGFLALVPGAPNASLSRVSAEIVEVFDGFRAPPTQQDLARRRQAPLAATHERLLARWGYPYVMEEFRFHLTLTGPLDDAPASLAETAAHAFFAEALAAPLAIDALCLFVEPSPGEPFRVAAEWRLAL